MSPLEGSKSKLTLLFVSGILPVYIPKGKASMNCLVYDLKQVDALKVDVPKRPQVHLEKWRFVYR